MSSLDDNYIDDGDDELTANDDDDEYYYSDAKTLESRSSSSLKHRGSSSRTRHRSHTQQQQDDIQRQQQRRRGGQQLGFFDNIIRELESIGASLSSTLLNLLRNVRLMSYASLIIHCLSIYLLFTLPSMGSNTYVSEKNLQCTVTPFITNTFSESALAYANEFKTKFPSRSIGSKENMDSALWIKEKMIEIGADAQLHYFNSSFGRTGVNVVGVNRAPRSLGTECFVLSTAFDQWHSPGAVGFLLAFLQYLQSTSWQARDVLFVITSEGGELNGGTAMDISGISVWTHDYHASPIRTNQSPQRRGWTDSDDGRLIRSGYIYGAIALDRVGNSGMEKLVVYPEGLNGALSNLDIINVLTTTSYLNEMPAGIVTQVGEEEDDGSLFGLLVFMWNSALSMPRSNHAVFTKYGINSVGVSTYADHNIWDMSFMNSPLHNELNYQQSVNDFNTLDNGTMFKLGKIIETSLRHLHNADEQLHQSFSWYMMAGAVFFIDLGQALLPLIFLSVSLFILLLSLITSVNNINYSVIRSLPWFISILAFCLMELCLPRFLASLGLIPSKDLNPSNLLDINMITHLGIDDQIIVVSGIYIVGCFIIYIAVLRPVANYFSAMLSTVQTINNGDDNHSWAGLQTILIAYYSLLNLMGMMLNNQFANLFICISLPTLQLTTLLLLGNYHMIFRMIWMLFCLLSHPLVLLFELWGTWSVGWKRMIIGVLAGHEWGFLLWTFFIILLQPLWIVMFRLLFVTGAKKKK
ncbi:hypothetical protein SAMD00019534_122540 [Acytostelium subglobosum LB1]|uniref:hypothetical protein n=1 Tax=Acytostelium subglobosum LB1 TaxID=1410327 RepID=UPI0006452069|nr:hypothetical protein SAMD00019534_126270 [Acytostelium subglobosum LB1]XP_012747923.1 hypothetical protein SAMD00019534_122540 [Acytostelium subglobosum LB1]GAM29078.1 hypothetical protein SAMD00019534_122540 [Acytostelium subglobosum LB1]GAM29451.1 hypothetical protein SAMD00019534_126270 [Acytostelium subglobosum LB1]|eukprot:XP_012747604.1 hypothetical protein SAMD00019534_126270 [Acytostelium subglobosum LB1]